MAKTKKKKAIRIQPLRFEETLEDKGVVVIWKTIP